MHTNASLVRLWMLAFVFLLDFRISLGSLYPTQPTEDTEYPAGQPAMILWKDDKHEPHLEDVGYMWIKLHSVDGNYVTTLAKHVSPTALSHSVLIPPLQESSLHFITFSFKNPRRTIYTANFMIRASDYRFPAVLKVANGTTTTYPNRTILTSATSPTNQVTIKPSATPTFPAPSALTGNPRADQKDTTSNTPHSTGNNNLRKGAGTPQFSLDSDSFEIFVVLLWPVSIGILLAV